VAWLAVGLAQQRLDRLLVGLHAEEAGDQPDHQAEQNNKDNALVGTEAAGDEVLQPLLALADDVFHVGRPARAERAAATASIAAAAAPRPAAIAATAAAPGAAAVGLPPHRSPQGHRPSRPAHCLL